MNKQFPRNFGAQTQRQSTIPMFWGRKESEFYSQAGKASIGAEAKPCVPNILVASPAFPRFYRDIALSASPNSNEAKMLARNDKKIVRADALCVAAVGPFAGEWRSQSSRLTA
jgi:hypothetical protein